MYDSETIVLREICNGTITLAAIAMIGIFSHYIWRRARSGWHKDVGVQAALAILILMFGHAIQRGVSWAEFLWMQIGWDSQKWSASAEAFLVATILIIIGKMLIIYVFSPHAWRWAVTLGTAAVAVTVPVVISVAIGLGWL